MGPRLHEKGGQEHAVPCHHNLERLRDEYITAAGIAGDPDGPLFSRHARIARRTLPLWLYVSVTGVVVYWMLYRL